MKTYKPKALQAWKLLLLSLPKGIAAFFVAVAGLSVSLPLSVFLIGLPLLAQTFVLCSRLLESERRQASAWRSGTAAEQTQAGAYLAWSGWRALLRVLVQGRSYRGLLYGFFQLPMGIAAFTVSLVIPVTVGAVMLSPLAYQVGSRLFSFDLFANDWLTARLLPSWTSYEISWLYGGIGAVLVLLMPMFLRSLGRLYAAWILAVAGTPKQAEPEITAYASQFPAELGPLPQYNP